MTSAGTVANRIVLLGGAAMLLGGGVVLLAAGLRGAGALPAPAEDVLAEADGVVAWSGAWGLDIPGAGFVPLWAIVGIAASALLVVLLVAFLLTRRFGVMLWLAVAISVGCSLLGVYLSFFIDSAPAPTIVLLMSACFIVSLILTSRRTTAVV